MSLTKEFKETFQKRIQNDFEFRRNILKESINEIIHGDISAAKIMLRDFVNASVTFKGLSNLTGISDKSLMRMLSVNGNPTIKSLASIIQALEKSESICLKIDFFQKAS